MNLVYNLVDFFFMNNNEDKIYNQIKRKKNKIIFDVGSFKGKFTEKILKLDKNKLNTKYYLFDPNPNGLSYIKELKKKNKGIQYNCIGLDNKIKKKVFHLNKFFEASGSSFQTILKNDRSWNSSRRKLLNIFNMFSKKKLENFEKILVSTNTIDNFCKDKKIKMIDLLKIDAEGHEEFILKGSIKLLRENKINVVYVEVLSQKNNFNYKKKKIKNYLEKYNLKFIKEYPIKSVGILSNLKSSDLLFINQNYNCE
tara:strand:+ start:1044 stop:1805 length:762 start_codon:yes stop_codon:yes gene_type:complete